jgi:dTDP-4-amino-4,6-dideoxygalactose transaminase
MFLTNSCDDAVKVRKWSTQSREPAPWYEHEEIGYNYRMSNLIAGVVRGQLPYLEKHIAQKKAIYERYKEGLKDLPVKMNPFDENKSQPNYWLSCLIIDKDAMASQKRTNRDYSYEIVKGKSSPSEILDALASFNIEGRPIWKPMHLQPIYASHDFVTEYGSLLKNENRVDCSADIFERGVCLPSDNKMTPAQQDVIIDIIHRCFD